MALETIIFTFKTSVPFEEWAKGIDSPEVEAMQKANLFTPLYRELVRMILSQWS